LIFAEGDPTRPRSGTRRRAGTRLLIEPDRNEDGGRNDANRFQGDFNPWGSVIYLAFGPGKTASPGVALMTLVDLAHLYVRVDVEETIAADITL
jgi:hypothetical protein